MKQKFRRFMAGFLAVLTMFTTLFTNGTTAFAASSSANISFWVASSKDHGVISEFNSKHTGSILYAMIDGHSAYCIDGYTINTTPQTVKIEYKDQNVTVQAESTTIKNSRQKAEVSVVKKDSDTDNPLTGGQYTLYAGNDIKNYDGRVIVTKGAALQTVTTGADGKATYTVDLPISNSFYIAETKAPVNYVRNSDDVYSFNFSVMSQDKAKATFAHTFKNDRTTAKIQIFKVDKETGKAVPQGDAKLEGAVYGLYARENIVHPDGKTGVIFKAGDLVATLTTDAKGACSIDNLYLGKYYVKEITPSEGYLLDEEEHDVVCDYEGDLIPQVLRSTTSKEQVIKQPFQLIKVSDNGDDTEAPLLAGAGFTAYLKSSLKVKADGTYDYESATPVVIGENGAKSMQTTKKKPSLIFILVGAVLAGYLGYLINIDTLTYDEFMMLGDTELNRRFSMQDEAEQKAKIDREQANELEYVDESQKSDDSGGNNTGDKPVRNPEREKPEWEDTITNRMLHWSYTPEQKEEVKKALAAGVPKATILTYFYPEVTVEKMSFYRNNKGSEQTP